jgi:hypothetical protein
MPKTKISEFSATPGNNTDIDGINIAEGCAPSGINDAIRELMAQLKDFQAGTAGDSFNGPVGTTTAAAGAFTTLSASSTVSGTGFSTYLASPPAIGGTAAAAGSFTTLTTSSTVTHNGGTANGVAYLNGSKVLTTGSALTYNGTGLGIGVSSASNPLHIDFDGTAARIVRGSAIGFLYNTGTSSTDDFRIQSNGGGVETYFATNAKWNLGGSEQMRLTSTGLGIGTSSPNYSLTSYKGGAVANYLQVASGATGAGSGNGLLLGVDASGNSVINAQGGVINLYTYVAGLLRTTIDSSGNLGLGVTPSAWNSDYRTMQFGATGLLYGRSGGEVAFGTNWYRDSGGTFRYLTTAAATYQAQASGIHYWFTAPSGTAGNAISFTQAMTLDASGNLGVGTTSPSARLDVSGGSIRVNEDGAGTKVITLRSNYASVGPAINVTTNDPLLFLTNNTERARIDSSGNLLVGTTSVTTGVSGTETTLCLKGNSANKAASFVAANASGTGISVFGTGDSTVACYAGTITNHPLVLQTNNTERARITSGGDLLVGTTSSAQNANDGLKFLPGGAVYVVNNGGTDGFSYYNTTAGAYRFYVQNNGTIAATNTTIAAISDQRLKENIQDLDVGLDKIMALKPRKFDWKAGKGKDIKGDRGWIAQEFEQVFPDMVDQWKDPAPEGEEPYKSVRADLIPVLVKAIQEQQALITDLRARVAALESNP